MCVSDAHATYDVDDIPAESVSRVAEHALGDLVELASTSHVTFTKPINGAWTAAAAAPDRRKGTCS